jgi:hypothetical protein
MKIYITTINLSNISKNINNLTEHLLDANGIEISELHSLDYGIHIVENNNIYRLEPDFVPHYNIIKNFHGHDLLLDYNNPKLLPVLSQIPTNYILTKIKIYEYKTNKKSNLKLIIKCIKTTPEIKIKTDMNYVNINTIEEPIDFYFEYENSNIDLTDKFLQEEFNMFLSHLN